MGIYLPNMEMPTLGYREIRIYPDGRVMEEDECGIYEIVGVAEQVPPHGDLVDRDALKKQGYFFPCAIGTEYAIPLRALREAPTIIPAEPCKEKGE